MWRSLVIISLKATLLYNEHVNKHIKIPGTPLIYLYDRGGCPSNFFGSEIVAQSEFFGSMKHAGIFLSHKKKTEGFFWVAKQGLRDFLVYAKKK